MMEKDIIAVERGNEMRFAFEAKTHYPGARFSVHPWWRRAPGKCVFVASNPEGNSETRAPYRQIVCIEVHHHPKYQISKV